MKKILGLILLFGSIICNAQNYQCLQTGVKHYFTNNNGYLRGVRIDSISTSGSDIIYYPFHTSRGHYQYSTGISSTLDSTGGSWLGKKVIGQNDGTFLFDNIWGDTVIINTQAHVGDSWIFYNDTTPRHYIASVSAEDTMTVLGNVDSVKKINITAYNSTSIDPSDSLNNFQITLSKNNGFVQVFDLYTFPYHAPDSAYTGGIDYYLDQITCDPYVISSPGKYNATFSLQALINPTQTQLYDSNPGDIFQYRIYKPLQCVPCLDMVSNDYPYQYYLDTVTNKIVAADSADYTYSGWLETQQYNMYTYVNSYVEYPYDFHYTNSARTFTNSLLIDTAIMPEEYNQPLMLYYFPADTTYCSVSPAYQSQPNEVIGNEYTPPFEAFGPVRMYKMGLGLVHYHMYDAGEDAQYDTTLIYTVKSGTACDTYIAPAPLSVSNVTPIGTAYKIFPEPATTILNIESTNAPIDQITITNIVGKPVYIHQYSSPHIQVDIAALEPGLYFLRINGTEVKKFVKR